MLSIGKIIQDLIRKTFLLQGRPKKWQPLALSTIERRKREGLWPGLILIEKGDLLQSFQIRASASDVSVFSTSPYAAIHHFGGLTGKGLKTAIPSRPFMNIQSEDIETIENLILERLWD